MIHCSTSRMADVSNPGFAKFPLVLDSHHKGRLVLILDRLQYPGSEDGTEELMSSLHLYYSWQFC